MSTFYIPPPADEVSFFARPVQIATNQPLLMAQESLALQPAMPQVYPNSMYDPPAMNFTNIPRSYTEDKGTPILPIGANRWF